MMNAACKTVAILIPCRNEERYIGRCLDSLLANDYDRRLLDVVVIDGQSDDRTREIVQNYARRFSFIRLLENPRRTKPAALNLGLQATQAEIVMRVDAHAVYSPGYVSTLVETLEAEQADNAGGIRETDQGASVWDRAIAIAISHPFAAGNATYRTGCSGLRPRLVDTVFGGCYPRRVFERIGGFHEELLRAQDREFNARLRAAGGRIVLNPAVRCTYYPRTELSRYTRWTFEGAYWLFYAWRFTRTSMRSWRNRIPAAFVLWHLCVAILAIGNLGLGLAAALPLLLYGGLNAGFSLRAAQRAGCWSLMPRLMLLFAVTHYAYGLGTWCGYVMARARGRRAVDSHPLPAAREQTRSGAA